LSAFAARKALASSLSKASEDQNGGALDEVRSEEPHRVPPELADSRFQVGNGMPGLAIMTEETVVDQIAMDCDENIQLSSYAQSELRRSLFSSNADDCEDMNHVPSLLKCR
jgi:hypothetical protein